MKTIKLRSQPNALHIQIHDAVCKSIPLGYWSVSSRGDYKFAEMISQKLSIAILSINLIGHPIHCIRVIMFKWLHI